MNRGLKRRCTSPGSGSGAEKKPAEEVGEREPASHVIENKFLTIEQIKLFSTVMGNSEDVDEMSKKIHSLQRSLERHLGVLSLDVVVFLGQTDPRHVQGETLGRVVYDDALSSDSKPGTNQLEMVKSTGEFDSAFLIAEVWTAFKSDGEDPIVERLFGDRLIGEMKEEKVHFEDSNHKISVM